MSVYKTLTVVVVNTTIYFITRCLMSHLQKLQVFVCEIKRGRRRECVKKRETEKEREGGRRRECVRERDGEGEEERVCVREREGELSNKIRSLFPLTLPAEATTNPLQFPPNSRTALVNRLLLW